MSGGMAQWLRAHTVFPEVLSSILALSGSSQSPVIPVPSNLASSGNCTNRIKNEH